MQPILSMSKKIDDIELYFEIFAKGILAENFHEVFSDGRFREPCNNIVVMLHGNGEDSSIFDKNIDAVCDGRYCMTVDSRGHGKSSCGNQHFTIDLLAEDLSKLCDELNLGSFSLLGFSDGGNIALTYAVRHPERPSALIVAGANINPRGLKFSARTPIYISYLLSGIHAKRNKESWLKHELLGLMVNYPHIASRLLPNISCPVLLLDGERDMIKRSHTDLIASSVKEVKRKTFKNSGHNIFLDATDEVNEVISEFLASLD